MELTLFPWLYGLTAAVMFVLMLREADKQYRDKKNNWLEVYSQSGAVGIATLFGLFWPIGLVVLLARGIFSVLSSRTSAKLLDAMYKRVTR